MEFWPPQGFAYVIIGAALLVLEMLVPGFFLLWVGAAAFVTGLVFGFIPASWQVQMVIFGALACIAVLIGRKYQSYKVEENTLNAPHSALIGQVFTLFTAIENGRGKIKVGDSLWAVEGEDVASGQVRVTRVNGTVLSVEKV